MPEIKRLRQLGAVEDAALSTLSGSERPEQKLTDAERLDWVLKEADVCYWWKHPREHGRPYVNLRRREDIDIAIGMESEELEVKGD